MLRRPAMVGLRTTGMKLTQALAVALTSLWVGNLPTWASPVLCSTVTSLGDWAASANGCTDAELRYALIESTLPKTTGFVAAAILLPSGTVHIVLKDMCPDGGRLDAYARVAALRSEYRIDHRRLHAVLDQVCNRREAIREDDDSPRNPVAVGLASVDGAPTNLAELPLDLSFFDVHETFVVQFGGNVRTANANTQLNTSSVPDPITSVVQVSGPASLILLGLGL